MTQRQTMTKRTNQVFQFIKGYMASNQEAPTIAEIARFLNFKSSSSVHEILVAMENRGMIRRTRKMRGITILA